MKNVAEHRAPAAARALRLGLALLGTLCFCLAMIPGGAQAQDRVREALTQDFARSVYLNSATLVHNEQPQPLLRAVVVLRVRLDEQDHWQAEVFRDNPQQPEMTRAALDSVARLPSPLGLSEGARAKLRGEGLIEAWLFQDDGRFALKTLAKPQRST